VEHINRYYSPKYLKAIENSLEECNKLYNSSKTLIESSLAIVDAGNPDEFDYALISTSSDR